MGVAGARQERAEGLSGLPDQDRTCLQAEFARARGVGVHHPGTAPADGTGLPSGDREERPVAGNAIPSTPSGTYRAPDRAPLRIESPPPVVARRYQPLSAWPDEDEFWGEVEEGLRRLIADQLEKAG